MVRLIEDAKRRGHRAYRSVNMDNVRAKAEKLPEHGVPPEIVHLLPHDDLLDKIQVQKAATPVGGRADLPVAAQTLAQTQPNAVLLEKNSFDEADINAQRIAAIRHFADRLCDDATEPTPSPTGPQRGGGPSVQKQARVETQTVQSTDGQKNAAVPGATGGKSSASSGVNEESSAGRRVERVAVITGNVMIDQFKPWYFGVAFPFIFKYCTGMPDMPAFAEKERYRRQQDAPRMEPPLWVRVMARRVEAQVSRDWHFGFVSGNYLFRSAVNLSRSVYAYSTVENGQSKGFTAEELQDGAISICKALHGKYLDVDGKTKDVRGDMTKVRYVSGLSKAAQRLLQNIEHTSRKIPGTQETRRLMRYDTHANRVRYGVPIFVTFSPDDAHNMLMLRL